MNDADNLYTILVKVLCLEGEESLTINTVNDLDMESLNPLLLDIKQRGGYFPTGKFYQAGMPSPVQLYSHFLGWDIFRSILPQPVSGINKIIRVELFNGEPPMRLEMC